MGIPNLFEWAKQLILDPISGQNNRTALEQVYKDYGIKDFKEKPLRQKFNEALYQISQNISSLDKVTGNFRSLNDFSLRSYAGTESVNSTEYTFLFLDASTTYFNMLTTNPSIASDAEIGSVGGNMKHDIDKAWTDVPDAYPNAIGLNYTGSPLVAGVYAVSCIKKVNGETNYIIDSIQNLNFPAVVENAGYIYTRKLFPIVYDGTRIMPFYINKKNIIYQTPNDNQIFNGAISANLTTMLIKDTNTNIELVPDNGEYNNNPVNREFTTRAKLQLRITGAEVGDRIIGMTGYDNINDNVRGNLFTEIYYLDGSGTQDLIIDIETNQSRFIYFSQSGNIPSLQIRCTVISYENPFYEPTSTHYA